MNKMITTTEVRDTIAALPITSPVTCHLMTAEIRREDARKRVSNLARRLSEVALEIRDAADNNRPVGNDAVESRACELAAAIAELAAAQDLTRILMSIAK